MLLILQVDPTPSEGPTPVYSPESFSHLNVEHVPSTTSWLNGPTEEGVAGSYCQHMRVLRDYKSDVHKKLREGLEWMFENDLQPKLEGRYSYCIIVKGVRKTDNKIKALKCKTLGVEFATASISNYSQVMVDE